MKVLLRTFGCRANHYDSEAVRALVERGGHEIVDDATDADLAVFNSCAVTTEAEADLRKAVRRAARQNPRLRSTIMGCASGSPQESTRQQLLALPTVTGLVAGADLAAVGAALGIAEGLPTTTHIQSGTRALLRIQDGCDEHCTFCATTLARGANRSRAMGAVVDEARTLATSHPEIVLTGIHIGTYGRDIGVSLGQLVERLVREVPGVRFRLTSVEATEVDAQLAELLTGIPARVAPSLHAPLQSGSDRVLRRMGRHWYSAASYARMAESLAARAPVFGLGADVICGFPGETDDDHAATVALVRSLPFTYLHVFPFSPRPGTPAERLRDPVSPTIAARRAEALRDIGSAKAAAYAVQRDGGNADVVVLAGASDGTRAGMTEDYLTVAVADRTLPRGARIPARLVLEGRALVARPIAP